MANFLRKFMHKNRSSETPSPSKFIGGSNNEIDNDFHHFRIPSSLEPYPSSAAVASITREPVRRTHSSNNYYEPSNEYFQLSTPQPPRRTFNKHQKSPANFGPPHSKAASTQFLNNGGLGSNEYLTETWNSSNPYNEIRADWSPKPRSISPRKSPRETSSRTRDEYETTPKRSPKSTSRRRKPSTSNTYDYLNPQCKAEGCSAAIIVELTFIFLRPMTYFERIKTKKLIGCERCLPNYNQCELGKRLRGTDFQAFYQCDHGIWAFHEKTEECFCQAHLYKSQISADRAKIATLSNGETTDFINGSPLPRERDDIYYGDQLLSPPRSPSPNKSSSSKHRPHSRSKTYLNSAESS
uniref:Uncharacterized protein n=1 Tax=Panagrolaimus sp. PS1159 TaxID=55785 RepID=A0AC35FN13_9BILA